MFVLTKQKGHSRIVKTLQIVLLKAHWLSVRCLLDAVLRFHFLVVAKYSLAELCQLFFSFPRIDTPKQNIYPIQDSFDASSIGASALDQ